MSNSQKSTGVTKTTDGQIVTGPAVLKAVGLAAGSDAAIAEFRDGGASGAIRWTLKAVATAYAGQEFPDGLRFTENVYVNLSGTAPTAMVALDNPQANQLNPS